MLLVRLPVYRSIKLEGGYLDFSHLSELKNIYFAKIYLKKKKKKYKASIIRNHKITKKKKKQTKNGWCSLIWLRSLLSFF